MENRISSARACAIALAATQEVLFSKTAMLYKSSPHILAYTIEAGDVVSACQHEQILRLRRFLPEQGLDEKFISANP